MAAYGTRTLCLAVLRRKTKGEDVNIIFVDLQQDVVSAWEEQFEGYPQGLCAIGLGRPAMTGSFPQE